MFFCLPFLVVVQSKELCQRTELAVWLAAPVSEREWTTNQMLRQVKGTVHEKTFFPGKGALGPSEYESSKKNPIKIKQGAQN